MAAKATDAAAGTYGYPISTDASNLFAMVISRGADYYSADKAGYNFDKPQIIEALTFIKTLYAKGSGKKIAERYGDQTDFGNRKALFTIGSSSGLPFYQQAVDKGTAGSFAWSVAALPYSTAKPTMNMYGASISIVKTTPEKQLASWLFLKWLTEPAQQRLWTELSAYFPTRISVRDSLGPYLKANPKFADAMNVMLTSDIVTEPPFSSYEAVRREISTAMNAILDGADVKQTVVKLTATAKKINDEDK
jgi:ABC-type glycerol-3-phosphate transport system substrate-binding protein